MRGRVKLAISLLYVGLIFSAGLSITTETSFGQSHEPITGRVFNDYNADGVAGPNEHGIAGILVYAYGDGNIQLGAPVATSSDGTYAISGFVVDPDEAWGHSRQVRLEFVVPAAMDYLQPPLTFEPSAMDATTAKVIFATIGDRDVNIGFNDPANYCQRNPNVITSRFLMGDRSGRAGNEASLLAFPYMATGTDAVVEASAPLVQDAADGKTIQKLATYNQVGSIYGLAYQRTTGLIYASAFQKRFADFGPGGADAIYQLDKQGNVREVLQLGQLAKEAGLDRCNPGRSCAVGFMAANAHDFTIAGNELTPRDERSYHLSGKNGLGDLEISSDQQTLYTVNLWDRRVYAIDISHAQPHGTPRFQTELDGAFPEFVDNNVVNDGSHPAENEESSESGLSGLMTLTHSAIITTERTNSAEVTNSWGTPNECRSSEHRPMGMGWRSGKLWLGSVCEDGSAAYVHSLDPDDEKFELEVTIPLQYKREAVLSLNGRKELSAQWGAWSDTTADFAYAWENGDSSEISNPQPMLSDIEFDGPHMIIGLRDRFGDQSGFRTLHMPLGQSMIDKPSDRLYTGDAVGDILRVCWLDGDWLLEQDESGMCSATVGEIGPRPASGIGGSEYYYWDFYPKAGANQWSPVEHVEHPEVSLGSLLQLPGRPWVTSTASDPFTVFSGGILRLDNRTGQRVGVSFDDIASPADELTTGGLTLYSNTLTPSSFGHANGLGALEALCDPAPIEIGNRVWRDLNGDGIQDPTEPGLAGVNVYLFKEDLLVGRTRTDTNGGYLFGGVERANMFEKIAIESNSVYQVRIAFDQVGIPMPVRASPQFYAHYFSLDFAQPENRANGSALASAMLSPTHAYHDSNGDSNDVAVGYSTATVLTGLFGANNYSIDFGFYTDADLVRPTSRRYNKIQHDPDAVRGVFQYWNQNSKN